LWVGLLYSQGSLDAAWDRVKHWSIEEREALRHAVPREALRAQVPGGGTVHELAAEVLEIATAGLTERANLNSAGDNESGFLDPLRDVVASGKTFADRLLDRYHGEWQGDVSKVYGEYSF
jgi:glutamate--cysteine ligase